MRKGIVRCDGAERTEVSEAQMEVYGPEFTKETKSEETMAFTSVLIYKYIEIRS